MKSVRKTKRCNFIILIITLSLLLPSLVIRNTAVAEESSNIEIIDQQYSDVAYPVQSHIYNNYVAQSFKPSQSVLSSIALQLIYPEYPVTVVLYKAKANGFPNLTSPLVNVSANVFLEYGSQGFWCKFEFPDISVTPGDTYFIRVDVLEADSTCNWVSGANRYLNGSAWSFLTHEDYGFEVPERDYSFRSLYSATVFPPVAEAGPDQETTAGIQVNFTAVDSYDPDGQIMSYAWNMGDGTSLDGMAVNHIYMNTGYYTVTLEVTDNHGLTDTDICHVLVNEAPQLPENQLPVLIVEAEGYLGRYYNLPANHSEVEGPITGIVTGDSPFNHDWYDEQYYSFTRLDANLTFGNNFFPVDEGLPGDPFYFATHWETTINATISANYSFEIGSDDDSWVYIDNQMVCDLGGIHAMEIFTHTAYITEGPHNLDIYFAERRSVQSSFYFRFLNETIQPMTTLTNFNGTIQLFVNQTLKISAVKSYDPDGNVTHYAWNFNDGTIEYNTSVTHSYTTIGNYSLGLSIVDDKGGFSTATISFEVVQMANLESNSIDSSSNQTLDSRNIGEENPLINNHTYYMIAGCIIVCMSVIVIISHRINKWR